MKFVIDINIKEKLINAARSAKKKAYSPYSNFRVGAALLLNDGSIVTGCNIENISFTPTVCAERVAIFKAVSEGNYNFDAIAIVTDDSEPSSPCGVCLQVMSEFVNDDFSIIMASNNKIIEKKFIDLLGRPFRPLKNIGQL